MPTNLPLRASLIRQHLVKPPAACAPTRVEKRGDMWHIVPSIVPFGWKG